MYNKQEYLLKGKDVEQKLMKHLMNCVEASIDEDINQHIDLKQSIGIDVKGIKKLYRDDDSPNENYHWIEIKNVNGDNGWMYGESDFIAFETEEYFFITPRLSLKRFVEHKCKSKIWSVDPALYQLYRRKERPNECLTLIKTIDIAYLSTQIIKKDDSTN